MTDDAPMTWVDPDTGSVELPLHLTLEWFDKFRRGVVGVFTLTADGEGGWTIIIQPAQGMIDQAVEKLRNGGDDGD